MTNTYTLTGQITDLVGTTSIVRIRGYVEPSQDLIADASINQVRLGSKSITFNDDGSWVVSGLIGTGLLVAGYRVVIDYVDDTGRQVARPASPWFALTSNLAYATAVQNVLALSPVDTTVLQSVYSARDDAAASAQRANLAAQIALNGSLGWGLDTDGQPYYDTALRDKGPVLAWLLDTDGVPFYVTAGA